MKISVIIPTYNRKAFLKRSLDSVFNQSLKPDEVLLIDDCSTDGTKDFVKNYKDLKYIKMPENKGVSAARNLGIKAAKNPWLAFLDSDDEWLPTKLNEQANELKRTNLKFCHSHETWLRDGKILNQKKKHQKSGGWLYENCLPLCCISPSTSIIHKSIFDDVGLFKEDFPVCEDYDLWLRVCAKYEVAYVKTPQINKYGGHEDQLSFKFKAMDYWRLLSLKERYEDDKLSLKYKESTYKMIKEKYEILKKGYIKHERLLELEKLETLLKNII